MRLKKVKSISFNDEIAEEKEMLKHFRRRNFSKYVKKLIREDIARKKAEINKTNEKNKPLLTNQRFKSKNGVVKINLSNHQEH